jgi:hypothetical protein
VSYDPAAVALGDQVHAEILERANALIRHQFAEEGIPISPEVDAILYVGIQAGLHTALKVMVEKDWVRIP